MKDSSTCFLAGDEGFEPPILGPEPSALPLGQSPIISQKVNTRCLTYYIRGIRVTSGDPGTSLVATSCHRKIPLRNATGISHPILGLWTSVPYPRLPRKAGRAWLSPQ